MVYRVTIEEGQESGAYNITWLDKQEGRQSTFQQIDREIKDFMEQVQWHDSRYHHQVGERLFQFLDGSNRYLTIALQKAEAHAEIIVLQLVAKSPVSDWPFELLAEGGEFLLHRKLHLVRCVSSWGSKKELQPVNRPLSLLFMASSPLDIQHELEYEKEEEEIFKITEKLPVEIDVEDSGSLTGLAAKLEFNKYDIVHLSGHAYIDRNGTPLLVMEDETGIRNDVDAITLWHNGLKSNPPIILFLSECQTGQVPINNHALSVDPGISFTERLAQSGEIPLVIGWGRSVSDIEASFAEKIFYKELSRGQSVMKALQSAREELSLKFKDFKKPAWSLLRVFGSEMNLQALVTPNHKVKPKPHAMVHTYLKQGHVKVLETGFIGRRRQMQQSLTTLLHDEEKFGVLFHGAGGLGKSCLVGKLCKRFPSHHLIVIHGVLNALTLDKALGDAFLISGDEKGNHILSTQAEMKDKLARLCVNSFKETSYLIILDDFEQNFENLPMVSSDSGCKDNPNSPSMQNVPCSEREHPFLLKPETIVLMKTLFHYLPYAGKMTQVLITSRYQFRVDSDDGEDLVDKRLESVCLTGFSHTEQNKKIRELPNIFELLKTQEALGEQLVFMGHGNPRLMEWIDQLVGQMSDAEIPLLVEAAKGKREEFIQEHVLRQLVERAGHTLRSFLQSFSIYRQPVFDVAAQYVVKPRDIDNCEQYMKRAVSFGLIEYHQARQLYIVTPMLREELEKELPPPQLIAAHRGAFEYYGKLCEPMESASAIDAQSYEEWIYHALKCGDEVVASEKGGYLVKVLTERLAFLEARRIGEWILSHKKEPYTTEHDAILLNNLGEVFRELGEPKKAIKYYKQALAIDEKVFGKENSNVAIQFNNLGSAWKALGKIKKAIGYYEQALNLWKIIYGEEHPHIATALNNLGEAFRELGKPKKAIDYFEQALAIDEKVLGKKHPNIAGSLNNLGLVCYTMGETEKSIDYYEQALEILKEIYGEEHPQIATALNNIGVAWKVLGEIQKAIGYFEQALDIDKKIFGKVHSTVARELNNLGSAWRAWEEPKKAFDYYKQALEILEEIYGEEHPQIATALNNLGAAWDDFGDKKKAIGYYEQALVIDEKVFGKEHHHVAIRLNNLGSAYFQLGDKNRARLYFERAYDIYKKFYGPTHPDTLMVQEWLDNC